MKDSLFYSRQYIVAFAAVTIVAVGLAFFAGDSNLGLAASILGLYLLHLLSLRFILESQRDQWNSLQELGDLVGELARAERLGPEAGAGGDAVAPAGSVETRSGETGEAGPADGGGGGRRDDPLGPPPEEAAPGGDAGGDGKEEREVPVPRHFALGTVAIIKNLLGPEEVAQILLEQRENPRLRFGEIGIRMGFLNEPELEELLLIQQQGLFRTSEIRDARQRLEEYREHRQELLHKNA